MVYMSIIVPTFNEEKILDETLKSIVSQGMEDKELIIADGESKDKTLEIARKYTDKIYSSKDKSVAYGRNKVLPYANGEVIVYVDADVRLYPGALEEVKRVMQNPNTSAGFFEVTTWDGTTPVRLMYKIGGFLSGIFKPFNVIWAFGPCMFFRRKALDSVNGFNDESVLDDADVFNRLHKNKQKFVKIGKPVHISARKFNKQGLINGLFDLAKIWQDDLKGKKRESHHEIYQPVR